MRKYLKRRLAILLSAVMVVSLFVNVNWTVKAEELSSISREDYPDNKDYWIAEDKSFESIIVPAEYSLTIAGANVSARSVTIEAGGCIHIVDNESAEIGQLTIAADGLNVSNGAQIECASKENIPIVGDSKIQLYDGDSDITDSDWEWKTFSYEASESGDGKWYLDVGNQEFEGLRIHTNGATVQYKVDSGSYSDIQMEENGDAEINKSEYEGQNPSTITLKFTTGNEQTIYGIEIKYNDGTNDISKKKPLNENGEYTLDAQYSYEIDVIDWECPMDNQYCIRGVGLDTQNTTVTVGGTTKEFDQVYPFETQQAISLTASETVYKVYAGDCEFSFNNGVYTYTPSEDTAFDILIYASEAWYNYDHVQPGDGQFAVEYEMRRADESDTSSVSCSSPTPVQQITADNRTKLILDNNVTNVLLKISPATGYHYEVFLNGSDVTSSVNNDVYSWTVDSESWWNNPVPEVRFIADGNASGGDYEIEVDFNPDFGTITEADTLPTGITKSGSRPIKYTVQKNTTGTLRINIVPNPGYTIDKLSKDGNTVQWSEDNDHVAYYEFNLSELTASVSMNVEFKSSGTTGEGGNNPGEPQDPKVVIPKHEYAYYVNQSDVNAAKATFKKYLATEIWWEFFNPGRPFSGQYEISTTPDGVNGGIANLESKITLAEKSTTKDQVADLYYYSYEVALSAATAEDDAVVVTGNAYILDNSKQFVVKTGDKYNVVEISDNGAGEANDIRVKGSGDVIVFGNGTCTGGKLETGSTNSNAWHVSQEHSGLANQVANIGCKLIVCSDDFEGVSIKGEHDAAAWNFVNTGVYDTGASSESSATAEVYYGSEFVTIDALTFDNQDSSKAISGISVDTSKISANAVTINTSGNGKYSINFETGYDSIPLVINFNNGTQRYVTVNRVGLNIAENNVNNGNFDAWHGTDHTVKYDTQNIADEKAIYATFYYAGNVRPATPVSLFVTITTNSGVERKVINTTITNTGTRVNGSELGTASQGTDKEYDDFLIWSGSNADYNSIKKVEAIVYSAGSGDSFGGVKVGSGTGVVWNRPVQN